MRGCREPFKVTDRHREIEAEVAANGGSLTAEDVAHTATFDRVAMAWTRRRAQAWIRREQAAGKWQGAHAHDDGTIHVRREGDS